MPMHIDQAAIYLKSGRVLRVDVRPDGSFKSLDGDRTAWLRNRFGQLRR